MEDTNIIEGMEKLMLDHSSLLEIEKKLNLIDVNPDPVVVP
jgi:hypothetical protein